MASKAAALLDVQNDGDQATQEALSTSQDEARIAQEFMLIRRLRIISVIARTFGILFSLFVIVYVAFFSWQIQSSQRTLGWLAVSVLIGCDALFFIAAFAAAGKHLQRATISLLLAVDVASIWFLYFWSTLLGHKGDPFAFVQLVSLSLTIMLAGVFGNSWLAFATTVLTNVVTLVFGLAYASSELALFLITGILQQWAAATIAIVMAYSYQQALRDLSQAYIRARQLDELKERFITNVNHELRTPVMTVLGYIDYLQRTWQGLSADHLIRSFQKAHEVGEQLMRLIESILDVRRVDESHVENPEPVALETVCAQALQLVDSREAHLEGRAIRIEIPKGLMVWGETTRVQQILTNLLSNAGKYSPPGTPIEVAARVLPGGSTRHRLGQKGEKTTAGQEVVEITVRDHGLGIPPEQRPLLFNRFVRLPRDLASTTTGNGLGLYLCRTLVRAMDGHIWVESTGIAGEGSTFHVHLPRYQPETERGHFAAAFPG
jgi:signal transduction histidine kinase